MVLSAPINYWCIYLYHKYKVEYIELEAAKVVSIRVIIDKKILLLVSNIRKYSFLGSLSS